jgi:hypothetical protein
MLNFILDFLSTLFDLMSVIPPISLLKFAGMFAIESTGAFILGILVYLVIRPIIENISGKYLARWLKQ